MMATSNITVTGTWTKLADAGDDPVLIQCTASMPWEVAAVASDAAPEIDMGHLLIGTEQVMTRALIGAGYIFARTRSTTQARTARFAISK